MKQIETEKEKIYNHEIRIKSCFKNGWEKMNDSWKIENMIAEISIEGLAVKTQNKSKKGLKKKKKNKTGMVDLYCVQLAINWRFISQNSFSCIVPG